jgi:hypothetical protein
VYRPAAIELITKKPWKVNFSAKKRSQEIQKKKLILNSFVFKKPRYHRFIVLWITPTLIGNLQPKQECLM